jgi:hypothetical protein
MSFFAQKFLNAFAHHPKTLFLWKVDEFSENKEKIRVPGNVHLVSWMQQPAILGRYFQLFNLGKKKI